MSRKPIFAYSLILSAFIALNAGCAATQGDIKANYYVPFVGQPGPQASEKARQDFKEGATAQWSDALHSDTLFGHAFSADAINEFNRQCDLLPGQGSEEPTSPAVIMAKLEGQPFFDPALAAKAGLPKELVFEYYSVRDYELDAIEDEELRGLRAAQKHEVSDQLVEVGWRLIPEESLGSYYQRSGAEKAYELWQYRHGPNRGAQIWHWSARIGSIVGLAAGVGVVLSNKQPTMDGGLGAVGVAGLISGAGMIAGYVLSAPFAWHYWDNSGLYYREQARKEFNRYLRSKLNLSFAPQPGGALLAGRLAW